MSKVATNLLIRQPAFLIVILTIIFLSGLCLRCYQKIISDVLIFSFFGVINTIAINYATQLPGANITIGYLSKSWMGSQLLTLKNLANYLVYPLILIAILIIINLIFLRTRYYYENFSLFAYHKSLSLPLAYLIVALSAILLVGFNSRSIKVNYNLNSLQKYANTINLTGASNYSFNTVINNDYTTIKELINIKPLNDNFNPNVPDENNPLYYDVEKVRNNKNSNYFLITIPGFSTYTFNYNENVTSLAKDEFNNVMQTLYPTLFSFREHSHEYTQYFSNEPVFYVESFLSLGARPSYGMLNYTLKNYYNNKKEVIPLSFSAPRIIHTPHTNNYHRIYLSGFAEDEFNHHDYFTKLLSFDNTFGARTILKEKKDVRTKDNIILDEEIINYLGINLKDLNYVQILFNSYMLAHSNSYSSTDIALVNQLKIKEKTFVNYYLAQLEIERALKKLTTILTKKGLLNNSYFYLVPVICPLVKINNPTPYLHSLFKVNLNYTHTINTSNVSLYHLAPDILNNEGIALRPKLYYYPNGLPISNDERKLFLPETLTNSLYFQNKVYDFTKLTPILEEQIKKDNAANFYFTKQKIIDRYLVKPLELGF